MTAMGIPANAKQLAALVKKGEGSALEFKRSTGELKGGAQRSWSPKARRGLQGTKSAPSRDQERIK